MGTIDVVTYHAPSIPSGEVDQDEFSESDVVTYGLRVQGGVVTYQAPSEEV